MRHRYRLQHPWGLLTGVLLPVAALLFGLLSIPGSVHAGEPAWEKDYQQARSAYYQFKADKERQKFRHHWQKTAGRFERVVEKYPKSSRVDDALFTAGRLYYELYLISRVDADLQKAVGLFERLVADHPDSHLADDGQFYIALQWIELRKKPGSAVEALTELVERFPDGDVTPKARRMLQDLGGPEADDAETPKAAVAKVEPKVKDEPGGEKPAKGSGIDGGVVVSKPVLTSIGHDSGKEYARVTLETRTRAKYKYGILPVDKEHDHPRLYIDLQGVVLGPDLKGPVKVRDSMVRRIRFAPFSKDVIRVVIDLNTLGEHKVFPMGNPARVVVDISAADDRVAEIIGSKRVAKADKPKPPKARKRKKVKPRIPSKDKSRPGQSLSMLAGLKIRRVVIDPGHGGRDPGAIGPKKTLEKEITLDIAKRLATLLRGDKSLGLKEVILTRKTDRFLALERRTAIANKKNADLFISIHCNAHKVRKLRGVETFYLDLTNDRYSIKLAARENATSEKTISDLKFILADLALKSHVDDSIALGNSIQKALVGKLRRHYKRIKDLRLKPALFYVLIGARMPSVLVETSFISNPEDETRLRTKAYRQKVANGIHIGLKNFIEARNKALDPDSL